MADDAGPVHPSSSELRLAVEKLRKQVEKTQPFFFETYSSYEPVNFFLARVLATNSYKLDKALRDVKAVSAWRERLGADELGRITKAKDVLPKEINVVELNSKFPIIERGHDRQGRPVLYVPAFKVDARGALKLCDGDLETYVRYQIWLRERSFARIFCTKTTSISNTASPYFTMVMDMRNVRLSQFTTEFYTVVKRLVEAERESYAGRLGRLIIVRAPFFFGMIWQALKSWLGPSIEKKVWILPSRPDETTRGLLSVVDEANLPADFGGKARGLPGLEASNEEFFCNRVHFEEYVKPPPSSIGLLPEKEEDQKPPTKDDVSKEDEKEKEEEEEDAPLKSTKSPSTIFKDLIEKSASAASMTSDERKSHVDALVEAVDRARREVDAYERDALAVRTRLRTKLRALKGRNRIPPPPSSLADRETLEAEILAVSQEREALERAVAFARNYIDVEAESRASAEAEWAKRVRELEEENRSLRAAAAVKLGPDALRKLLASEY